MVFAIDRAKRSLVSVLKALAKAQEVAKAKFNAFKKVCCEVKDKSGGAASRS